MFMLFIVYQIGNYIDNFVIFIQEFNQLNKSASFNITADQRVNPGETSSAKEMLFSDSDSGSYCF